MRSAGQLVMLTLLWMFAWGAFTPASALSGLAVSAALLALFPPGPTQRVRLRPFGAVRLVGYVVVQLLSSNLVVARQILQPRPSLRQGVVAHRLSVPGAEVVTVMTTIIALSPGTMVVDANADSTTIHVHVLNLVDVEGARRSLQRLERLVVAALGADRTTETDHSLREDQ